MYNTSIGPASREVIPGPTYIHKLGKIHNVINNDFNTNSILFLA